MKKLLAAALGVAVVALALSVATPASAGSTSSYMHPKSSLRYHVDEYVFAPTTTSAAINGTVIGAVPPGKHTLKCVTAHLATVGAGTTNRVRITPKKNGTSLVLTAGEIGTAAGANTAIVNANCPMGSPANLATVADSFVLPVLTTTASAITASGGDVLSFDAAFVNTWTAVPSLVLQLFYEPIY
jgi:hypothetical protein